MNNYQLYGCAPRFDNQDQSVVYQMKTNKNTNYFEEANEVKNCPQVRQMMFKNINDIKKEIIFRIKFKQIIPCDKFLKVKPIHLFEFDNLLLTLIETLYFLNKKNIYIEEQYSESNIQLNSRQDIIQELKLVIREIQSQIKATAELIQKHQQEINFNEFNKQLKTLNQQLNDLNINIALLPQILERFEYNQKNKQISFIKKQLIKIQSIFNDPYQQKDLSLNYQYEESKIQEEKQTSLDQQNIKESQQKNAVDFQSQITPDIQKNNTEDKRKRLKQNESSIELQKSQKKTSKQKIEVYLLDNIYNNLQSYKSDFLNSAIQSIISLKSEESEQYINSQQKEILTPLEYELNILPLILNNYGLYLKQGTPQPQPQNLKQQQYQSIKMSSLPETINEVVSTSKIQNQVSQIIDLDWDHFQIYLMQITKRQDKNYQNQIDLIKYMIKQFIYTNMNHLQNNSQFKEIIMLRDDLDYESQIDMKFVLKQDYIKNLLNKTRLKQQFQTLETQGYIKQDYIKIKKLLQKSFYDEMIIFYKIRAAISVDNKLQFFRNKLSGIRIIQIRIHVLKEFKRKIKQLLNSVLGRLDEAKNILNSLLLNQERSAVVWNKYIQQLLQQQLKAFKNHEQFKNFWNYIQTKINKLEQNPQVTGIRQEILKNPQGQNNQSFINATFGELMQKKEIMNKFNKLIKYYKTSYDQIYKADPTQENFYRYILYRSLRFLQGLQMPYDLSILLLYLPYDYDYEEYYLTIRNGSNQDVIELINNNGSKKIEEFQQKSVTKN